MSWDVLKNKPRKVQRITDNEGNGEEDEGDEDDKESDEESEIDVVFD